MKGPSLQKTAALSAALHLTAFLVTFIILRHSAQNVLPSPYIVSLVGPGRLRGGAEVPSPKAEDRRTETGAAPDRTAAVEETRLEERMAELRAKKKIEDIIRLRKEVATIRGRAGAKAGGQKKAAVAGMPGGTGSDTYISKITEEIHDHWGWPSSAARSGLEAIVTVSIEKDGTIRIMDFEKRSGNRLFDNFALDALRKASPVTPPPYAMEIGIRFYP